MNLTEGKVQAAIQEIKEWLEVPDAENERYTDVLDEIKENSGSPKIPKSILNRFVDLNIWYSNNFVYQALTNKGYFGYKHKTAISGYHVLIIADLLAKQYPENPPYLLLDQVGRWLATCLHLKWYHQSKELLEIINKGLGSFLKGGLDFKPTAWFIIAVANKGFNIYVDYKAYNYPRDTVYEHALDNWDTKDLSKLDNMVSMLCDFHLKNATYGTDQEDTANIQFRDSAEFVYAYEILAWLSIREKAGLKNPDKFTHPLMNLELNKLPKETAPLPQDELFEKVMSRLNAD